MDQSTTPSRKKPILLVIVILIVLLVLGIAAWLFFTRDNPTSQNSTDSIRVATLSFQQEELTVTPNAQVTLDILLDTGGVSVTEANVVLQYDPQALFVSSILPANPNLFGTSQEYQVDDSTVIQKDGLAFFKIRAVDTGEPPTTTRQGSGRVAQVTLNATQGFTGTTPLTFYINDETLDVSSAVFKANYDGSILEKVTDTTITVQ